MLEKLNSLGSIALIALAIAGPAGAAVTLLDKEDWKFQIGGFAELDMITDSTRSLTEVAGSSPIARPGGLNGENGRTQFSPRNSRLFFALTPPVVADWKTKGHVEVDLLGTPNGPSEGALYTSPTLRLRHAFLSAETNGFQVLAGQYWTLFGWQTAYLPPTVQVPPVTGVAYERTPQLLVMKSFGALQAAASIFRPVQRDAKLPGVDGGLRYTFEGWKGGIANSPTGDVTVQSMSVAVTGTVRGFETPAGTGSATDKTHQTG